MGAFPRIKVLSKLSNAQKLTVARLWTEGIHRLVPQSKFTRVGLSISNLWIELQVQD